MKLVFLINRIIDYNVYSRLINYAIKYNHQVICFHNYTIIEDPNRSHRFPFLSLNPFKNKVQTKKVYFNKNLYEELSKINYDLIFTKTLPPITENKEFIEKIRAKVFIVMDSLDIYDVCKDLKLYKNYKIKILLWSFYFKKKLISYLKKYHYSSYLTIKRKAVVLYVVGHNYYNLKLNKEIIKRKLRIPRNKKVILYCPYAYDDNNVILSNKYWKVFFAGLNVDFFPRITNKNVNILYNIIKKTFLVIRSFIFSPHKMFKFFLIKSEYKILEEISNFCKKNNYYLIVKSRKKYFSNLVYYKFGDSVFNDEQTKFYPSLLQEIISITDLNICYSSNVALEVSLMNIQTINIKTSRDDWPNKEFFEYWGYNNSFFNFRNLIKSYDLKDFKINLAKSKKEDFKKYTKTYLGSNYSEKNTFKILKKELSKD
jgi:hypothetical protein